MNRPFLLVSVLAMACLTACPDDSVDCESPELVPSLYPINMGTMLEKSGDTGDDPATNDHPPFTVTLLMSSLCQQPVVIDTICMYDGTHFSLRGPEPSTVASGDEAAIEITYDRDGSGAVENDALIIQSNASNFPTMVIPICARTVADAANAEEFSCESPVTVPDGTKDATLCP